MTISCPTCHATLIIPDERLPRGRVIGASCPHCRGRVTIDTSAPAPAPPPEPTPPTPAADSAPLGYDEEERPAALVCVGAPVERESITATLKREGYRVEIAGDAADTIPHLRFTGYTLVILREGFGSPQGDGNPELDRLADMPMVARRRMQVVLVSPALRSHDRAAAFAHSVNLVLNVDDLPHLAAALKQSHAEADETYRVFLETLRSAGKV